MQVMKEMRIPLPKAFATATELIIGTDIRKELRSEELDFERIEKLVEETKRWSLELDMKSLGFVASERINSIMEELSKVPEEVDHLQKLQDLFGVLSALPMQLDLWKAQNTYFSIGEDRFQAMQQRAAAGDENAREWIEHFKGLGNYLHVKCP